MSDWPEGAAEYVQAIADTKLMLGYRYAQWTLAGPTLEDDIGGASAAQEEFGHVRQLFHRLEGQSRSGEWLRGQREPREFANAACLDDIDGDWPTYIGSIAPADRAAWYLLDAIEWDGFAGLVTKIGEDEYFHLDYHDARLETLTSEDPGTIQETLERTIPQALAFIGPQSYEEERDPLYSSGFTGTPIAVVREAFIEHYRTLFEPTEVSLENVDWSVPDIDGWDESRRRAGGGGITEADLHRIRGEENALFARN